jgi:hypothetical protein
MTNRHVSALQATTVLAVVVLASLHARPAEGQTVAAGPYYATPSWDQTFPCSTPAACPRFVVLSNMGGEAVLDRETGLVWQREPRLDTGTWGTWETATNFCWMAEIGHRKGWRLPMFEELGSLLPLPDGHPFALALHEGDRFWTGTSYPLNMEKALVWRLMVPAGSVTANPKSDTGSIVIRSWCVRGPQSQQLHHPQWQ